MYVYVYLFGQCCYVYCIGWCFLAEIVVEFVVFVVDGVGIIEVFQQFVCIFDIQCIGEVGGVIVVEGELVVGCLELCVGIGQQQVVDVLFVVDGGQDVVGIEFQLVQFFVVQFELFGVDVQCGYLQVVVGFVGIGGLGCVGCWVGFGNDQ